VINVTDVTQTSVTVSWCTGQTRVVNTTVVYYRPTSTTWQSSVVNDTDTARTRHTVTALQPGTEYQVYVEIYSYGKTATSESVTVTTGEIQLPSTLTSYCTYVT